MPYVIQNSSKLSVVLAKAIEEELQKEMRIPYEVAHLVVSNYNLEEKGLASMVSEISKICKIVWSGEEF